MGINSTINQFCRIDNRGGNYLDAKVSVSPYLKIPADHDINRPEFLGILKQVVIGD
jgi:hypothetical protein